MLAARHPARALELHRAASDWYAQHDDPRRAVRHAILAEDPALVTRLLRGRMLAEFFTGTSEMVREWINDLSRVRIDMPAELMLEYALALALVGALDDARIWLTRVDDDVADDAPAVSRARVAIAHALTLGLRGEIATGDATRAEQARALVEPGVDGFIDGRCSTCCCASYMYTDDLVAAARTCTNGSRPAPRRSAQLDQVIFEGIFSQAELEAGAAGVREAIAETAAASAGDGSAPKDTSAPTTSSARSARSRTRRTVWTRPSNSSNAASTSCRPVGPSSSC